jgi:hypothetical protein
MNTPTWMAEPTERVSRAWVKRARGRRASDRSMRLETVLAVGVVLAWSWGVYELTLLFLH